MATQTASRMIRKLGGRVARMRGGSGDFDWQAWFRATTRRKSVEAVLLAHENASALTAKFNVGAYMERNQDISDVVGSAGEAVFHFLEFGLAEDRSAAPKKWSPAFVRKYHGIALPETLTATEANARLRGAGVPLDNAFLREEHLWQAKGVCGPIFAGIFEHSFYAVAAEAAGMPVPSRDRLAALRHFCDVGRDAGIAPHPSHRFDAAFYRAALAAKDVKPGPKDNTEPALLRHWAQVGVRSGLHANPKALFLMELDVHLPDAVLASLPAFQAASADLAADASLPEVLTHLMKTPLPGAAAFDRSAPGVIDFLLALARAQRRRGDAGNAEWLLNLVLAQEPKHPRASLDLADLIFSQNRLATEVQLREAVPPDFDIGSNQITLAERLFVENRWRDSLRAAERIPATFAADVTLTERRRSLAISLFEAVWHDLDTQMERLGIAEVQDYLRRALTLATRPVTSPVRSKAIRRVAILANDDLYQCKLYRADQKLDHLRAAGFEAEMFSQNLDVARLKASLDRFDAVIFMRVPAFPRIIDLIVSAMEQGLATFYDCDDLIFDPSQFPPPLATYSGTITKAEHAAIACGVPLFAHAMSLCDYGIASTPTIQAAMAPVVRSGQVFLHRNALGKIHLQAVRDAPAPKPKDKLVLYYGSGTKAHKQEFHDILEPALAEVLQKRRGKVEVRVIGDFADLNHLNPTDPDVQLISPIWDFEAFCQEVAQADINLSVLTPTPITDAKSEIKWMEAAMFGVPSIVTPTATHLDVIQDGKTGLLRSDKAGFVEALLMLIDAPKRRAEIGAAARAQVMQDYGLPAMGRNFVDIFDTVRPPRETRKPHLVIVNVFYPPQDIGGATRVVQDNVRDLIARYGDRFDIDVVCTLDGGRTPYEVTTYAKDGVRVWAITSDPNIGTMDETDHKMRDAFGRLMDRLAPDLIHFHCIQRLTASVVDVARMREIPYAISLHDGWWISPNQFIATLEGDLETYDFNGPLPARARVTGRALRDAAALLAVSPAFEAVHRAIGIANVETVENGLSALPQIVGAAPRDGRVRVGHIGGASRHKGYALIRAAVESVSLSNTDLVILDHALPLGQSRTETWNGTPVTFLPRLPLHRVGEVYGQIDVLLAPSTWPESYGLVTREALALGLWVVASDMGAIGQGVVEGQTGHIVSVTDHTALAACLSRMDAAPETYGKPTGHPLTPRPVEAQVDELVAIYDRILAARPSE